MGMRVHRLNAQTSVNLQFPTKRAMRAGTKQGSEGEMAGGTAWPLRHQESGGADMTLRAVV